MPSDLSISGSSSFWAEIDGLVTSAQKSTPVLGDLGLGFGDLLVDGIGSPATPQVREIPVVLTSTPEAVLSPATPGLSRSSRLPPPPFPLPPIVVEAAPILGAMMVASPGTSIVGCDANRPVYEDISMDEDDTSVAGAAAGPSPPPPADVQRTADVTPGSPSLSAREAGLPPSLCGTIMDSDVEVSIDEEDAAAAAVIDVESVETADADDPTPLFDEVSGTEDRPPSSDPGATAPPRGQPIPWLPWNLHTAVSRRRPEDENRPVLTFEAIIDYASRLAREVVPADVIELEREFILDLPPAIIMARLEGAAAVFTSGRVVSVSSHPLTE